MIDCNMVREVLALQPSSEDQTVRQHLEQCSACASYQRTHRALDVVLRAELHWEVPATLTAQLLALAADPAALSEVPLSFPRSIEPALSRRAQQAALVQARPLPKRWYVMLVYMLTVAVIGLSLLVAWQFFGMLAAQVGLEAALMQLLAAPAQGLSQLVRALPESRYAIDFFFKVRAQLMWLLLVAVLWAVLDKWNVQFNFGRRQISS
jgi:anti-sigma factor RsiW